MISGEVCHAHMTFNAQASSKKSSLLAVLSGKSRDNKQKQKKQDDSRDKSSYPLPELASSWRLEVTIEFLFVHYFFCSD